MKKFVTADKAYKTAIQKFTILTKDFKKLNKLTDSSKVYNHLKLFKTKNTKFNFKLFTINETYNLEELETDLKTFKIEPNDFFVPVCHQGMNRSQVMRLVLCDLICELNGNANVENRYDTEWVSRTHGAVSGCDPHAAWNNEGFNTRDKYETDFFKYLYDEKYNHSKIKADTDKIDELRKFYGFQIFGVKKQTDEEQKQDREKVKEMTVGLSEQEVADMVDKYLSDIKKDRLGQEAVNELVKDSITDKIVLNPAGEYTGKEEFGKIYERRREVNDWFNNNFFKSIDILKNKSETERHQYPFTFPPKTTQRRIFVVFARGFQILIDRFKENQVKLNNGTIISELSNNDYFIHLNYDDTISQQTRLLKGLTKDLSAEERPDMIKKLMKEIHLETYAIYKSLFTI